MTLEGTQSYLFNFISGDDFVNEEGQASQWGLGQIGFLHLENKCCPTESQSQFGLGARGFSSIRSRSKCINLLVPVAWVTSNEWYPEGQQSGARLTERGKFVT